MSLYKPGQPSTSKQVGITEFEILKASHKFLREQDEKASSWDEQLAAKYYASLYREFALCDLKHYKSGNFALRWRTEEEVLAGSGETTCGNTRCEHHFAPRRRFDDNPEPVVPLTTLELPFVYEEHGENKSALVKVVLCGKCLKRLMWKRTKEKGMQGEANGGLSADLEKSDESPGERSEDKRMRERVGGVLGEEEKKRHNVRREKRAMDEDISERRRKRRNSRSHSPRRTREDPDQRKSHS